MNVSRAKSVPTIAITIGDPAGIGPEVVAKTLRDRRLPKGFRYVVLGKSKGRGIKPGILSRTTARSAIKSLEQAAQGCLDGRYDAMVTGPVQKVAIARLPYDFIGQTEFLARACGLPDDAAVMVLTDPKLTVALCSSHCSLRDAMKRLSTKRIVFVTKTVRQYLMQAGIKKPRLAFAGVNPHMGENGLFGSEDLGIVLPACKILRQEKIIMCHLPADTVFYYAVKKKSFDAVICAYHDQGLIPFKQVAFETGVNITLGLPLIRTSPDHGTALEIAGQGKADHRSMLAAVQLACRLVRTKAGNK
jgi:4-hydroxythreonine-4-phosphate dehydrogenase